MEEPEGFRKKEKTEDSNFKFLVSHNSKRWCLTEREEIKGWDKRVKREERQKNQKIGQLSEN